MRYALISDIHANLPALEAVLRDIAGREGVDATYHLGDLVGYAPWPNEVVEMLVARGIPGVAGNYDSTVATDYKHCGCHYEDPRQEELSHLSYVWTLEHVTARSKAILGALPFRIDLRPNGGHVAGPTVTLVHGNHTLNTVYIHRDRSDAFLEKMGTALRAGAGDVVCFGHTHVPWHRVVEGVNYVNAGSVGRPKDGDWRASYVVLDVGALSVNAEIVRVDYDLEAAAQAIIASELPDDFAEYLRRGGAAATARPSRPAGRPR
ncbi:MAG TPA: metallophosphoesterase family protein [Gemmatimonadaceae bacterium]|nr:metallophosphoesterase family protein [Gemmatimonadaceae bacterium]